MKLIFKTLLLILLVNTTVRAQQEIPYNLDEDHISDSKGFSIIKSTITYSSTDYHAETYNYFDKNGLNYLTVNFFKGEKQGFARLTYDERGNLKGVTHFSRWINSYDSKNKSFWDSTLISWENRYQYDSLNRLNFCSNQWCDDKKKPEYRSELKIEYNKKGLISKKTEYHYDFSDSQYTVYFQANSTTKASKKNFPAASIDSCIYNYIGDTLIIDHYRQNTLKSFQKFIENRPIKNEFLFDAKMKLIRTTTQTFDEKDKLIEEKCVGDCEISENGEYSDGMCYDKTYYEYGSTGLLQKKSFINSKYNSKMYIEYEYLK